MTREFQEALQKVASDIMLDNGGGADLVAVGVDRDDCLELLRSMVEGEPITAELLGMMVQVSVATGVWLERERWQTEVPATIS